MQDAVEQAVGQLQPFVRRELLQLVQEGRAIFMRRPVVFAPRVGS